MAHKYPKDRFDVIPDDLQRVGAHRAPRGKGRGWIWVGWSALACVILIGAGVIGLSVINGTIDFKGGAASGTSTPTITPTPTPTIVPTVNPALHVTVLNGTTLDGAAGSVAATLTAAGWQNISTANASETTITHTIVYYSSDANKAAALAMAQSLPGSTTELTQAYVDSGADLTVVIGSDYKTAAP
ncbi:LytR C-terminal domain-containing protein [Rathayibacter soli]|uniref:LytR C-terminal domain-containing protein n=1 Tax=Rathayibacter soli TaxID=3144168 RepID=UPI0027E4445F|nr:LytR C-terminal domain-containing protein [Glaciibacter superstes]